MPQAEQADKPNVGPIEPAGHGEQLTLPSTAEKVLSGHGVQPRPFSRCPARHCIYDTDAVLKSTNVIPPVDCITNTWLAKARPTGIGGNMQVMLVCDAVCTTHLAPAMMTEGGAVPKSVPSKVKLLPPPRAQSVTALLGVVVAHPITLSIDGNRYDTALGRVNVAPPDVTAKANPTPDPAGSANVIDVWLATSVITMLICGAKKLPTATLSGGNKLAPVMVMVRPPTVGQNGADTMTLDESRPVGWQPSKASTLGVYAYEYVSSDGATTSDVVSQIQNGNRTPSAPAGNAAVVQISQLPVAWFTVHVCVSLDEGPPMYTTSVGQGKMSWPSANKGSVLWAWIDCSALTGGTPDERVMVETSNCPSGAAGVFSGGMNVNGSATLRLPCALTLNRRSVPEASVENGKLKLMGALLVVPIHGSARMAWDNTNFPSGQYMPQPRYSCQSDPVALAGSVHVAFKLTLAPGAIGTKKHDT
jgi:hypothetical protein